MTHWLEIDPDDEVNVEDIMRQIRAHIAAEGGSDRSDGATEPEPLLSERLRAQLALVEARSNGACVAVDVRTSSMPVVGPLVDRARRAAHQLVVFYVNMSARQQSEAIHGISEALATLADHLDQHRQGHDELAEIRRDIAELQQHVQELRP